MHSEHTVTIEKLIVGGNGLSRIQFQDKSLVVFVPQTAPQDKVKIKITHTEKNHLLGEVMQIIETSPSRVTPPCVYFEKCGGCNWQHINIETQIKEKEQILTDLIKKFIPQTSFSLLPTVKSENNFNYRNRIQLKFSEGKFGYFQKSSHQIVDISECLIAEKEISEKITEVKAKLRPHKELQKFELRINHLNQFEYYKIGEDGEGLSFSQVNNSVNTKLTAQAVDLVKTLNPKFITELYAGAGNFTFPLLEALPQAIVEAAELNSKLTSFAVQKLTSLKLQKRATFFTTDCEAFVSRRTLSADLIFLDPPRAGCSEVVLKQIAQAEPQHILYVSCHPANLARDLKNLLTAKQDYQIKHLQIFDMFPQTDHFETLVLLSKG
ncbi:MAG: class I SAM-dependent RNA methyltransferase [Pseudobdellovibrio sp.]